MKLSSIIECAEAIFTQVESGQLSADAALSKLEIKLSKIKTVTQEIEMAAKLIELSLGHVDVKTSNVVNFERTHITEDSGNE